ncbi:SDR family NAD(P)-dependent oxidoreductase, partial [Streptomyces fuscichromogenes]|uniref:SDR family NAD(P)-dependent oxidoreductase n=1 Tax=Streptomyces fuscichromogenes TaxID=1324013 RepID=UPI001670612A
EFVDASLRLLPHGGRFLEIGKNDVRDAAEVAAAHPGVRYSAYDVQDAGPDRIQEMLGELVALFEAGVLTPPPITSWDIGSAPEALRFLSQAQHVGKTLLTVGREPDPEGTVLITGATGALARLLAHHLVTGHGVRHLLLAGRRGGGHPAARELTRSLTAMGARVTFVACDPADPRSVAGALAAVDPAHPLTAVVHTAGVLDDAPVHALTAEQLGAVLAPKVDGAWNLHRQTLGLDLAAFVVYSSAAGLLGNAGQAGYAAANTFLDALAHHRHALGLPATSLAWGLWDTADGMGGRLDERARGRLAQGGVLALSPQEGLRQFDAALALRQPLVVGVGVDSAVLAGRAAAGLLDPLFGRLASGRAGRGGGMPGGRRAGGGQAAGPALSQRLAGLPAAERLGVLRELVRGSAAAVLGHASPAGVDPQRPFTVLGFDSLSAYELRNQLTAATGQRLPPTLIFDHPTPEALAVHLEGLLAPARQDPFAALLAEVDRLQERLGDEEAVPPGAAGRLAGRLQDFLLRLEESREAAGGDRAVRELSAATDEEIFDLIDNELGIA